jgi:subtilisin family serine protease
MIMKTTQTTRPAPYGALAMTIASAFALTVAAAAAGQATVAVIDRGPVGLADVEGGYASTQIVVRARPGVVPTKAADGAWSFTRIGDAPRTAMSARLMRDAKVGDVRPIAPNLRHRERAAQLGLDRTFVVRVGAGADVVAFATALGRLTALFETVELDGIGGVAAPPNDPSYPDQYALNNTGQLVAGAAGTPGADVNGPEAFDLATNLGLDTSWIVVGSLDSGINPHVELAGRILPGINVPDGTTITTDECSSHGTHVAGIVGAAGGNAVGIAGVAWAVQFKPYVVVNGCNGPESAVATALIAATDDGVKLVNMSLQYFQGSTALQNAVQYAAAADVIMVAATGNSGSSSISFPARWPETIAVGATNQFDARWSGSNFGPEIDLVAPGYSVLSLTNTNTYGTKTGTSMAVPHVTGAIALILAKNPTLTPDEVRNILQASAKDLGPAGFDNEYGYGRLDVLAALAATPSPLPADLDGDGSVGPADLGILLGAWGACADCDGGCAADLDGDCAVGAQDLGILLGSWS